MSNQLEHIQQMEMALIGLAIDQPDTWCERLFERLRPEDVSGRMHHVAAALYRLHTDGQPITPQLLMEELRRENRLRSEHGVLISDAVVYGQSTPTPDRYLDALCDIYLARQVYAAGERVKQLAASDVHGALVQMGVDYDRLTASAAERVEDTSENLADLLRTEIEDVDWLIPNLIPKSDRVLITSDEGAGKSTLLRQFALSLALGLEPFDPGLDPIKPGKVLLIDAEVSRNQLIKALKDMHRFAARHTHSGQPENLIVESRQSGVDLGDPSDQAWLSRMVREHNPQMIALGPLYRLTEGDINEEDSVRRWQRSLEPFLELGVSIVMEHHAPNASDGSGNRFLRPIGSSVIRRWFAQGIGMRPKKCDTHELLFCRRCSRRALVEMWRGSRDETHWPLELRSPAEAIWWLDATDPEAL